MKHRRELPWRENPSPYAVWVSEIMLQQTRASVVIPYYLRWMERFPTIASLSQASLEEVMKLWEGLGYYSRARALHRGAQIVQEKFGGVLPDSWEDLETIPGLGPYTVGAIRSFGFHRKAAAVDGNVLRVLARFFGIAEEIQKGRVQREIRALAEGVLPDEEPWVISEALIELGATVCGKKAKCSVCPLRNECVASTTGREAELPLMAKRAPIEKLYRAVAVMQHGDSFLLRRVEEGEIMSHLHEFPYFPIGARGIEVEQFRNTLRQEWGIHLNEWAPLAKVQHSFTRYQVTLWPFFGRVEKRLLLKKYQWFSRESLDRLPFSSGHRRIVQQVLGSFPRV